MKNIKTGIKLISSFLFLILLTIAIGVYLIENLIDLKERAAFLHDKGILPLELMARTVEQTTLLRVYARDIRLAGTAEERSNVIKSMEESQDILRNLINEQMTMAIREEVRVLLQSLQNTIDTFIKNMHIFVSNINQGKSNEFAENDIRIVAEMGKIIHNAMEEKIRTTEIITQENDAMVIKAQRISIVVLILALIISLCIGIYLTLSITKPLNIVVKEINKMANGDMTVRSNLERKDELGMLAKALDNLAIKMQGILKSLYADSNILTSSSEILISVSNQLASGSEESVSQSNTVASTTEQMAVNINAMASGAEEASVNANEVAGAAEQMSVNMNTIAAAVEEMSASINQIASNAGQTRKVASEASAKAGDATDVMNKLGAAAKEIGQVTNVIKKIADKTNLLALNATIEAASAGEAGKGFAVVAGEIKELANQSAQSADDIARRIEGIQGGTNDAVEVIHDVSDIIVKINQSVEAIADHVEQQTRASNEIASNVAQANTGAKRVAGAISEVAKGANDVSRNAGEAAKGAIDVSSNVVGMSQVAKESAEEAAKVKQSSSDLVKIADKLRKTVSQFKV